jgi:hypothetical protein
MLFIFLQLVSDHCEYHGSLLNGTNSSEFNQKPHKPKLFRCVYCMCVCCVCVCGSSRISHLESVSCEWECHNNSPISRYFVVNGQRALLVVKRLKMTIIQYSNCSNVFVSIERYTVIKAVTLLRLTVLFYKMEQYPCIRSSKPNLSSRKAMASITISNNSPKN